MLVHGPRYPDVDYYMNLLDSKDSKLICKGFLASKIFLGPTVIIEIPKKPKKPQKCWFRAFRPDMSLEDVILEFL